MITLTGMRESISALALVGAVVLAGLPFSQPSYAQAAQRFAPTIPGSDLHRETPKKGWFWYVDPVQEKKKKDPETVYMPVTPVPEPVEQPAVVVPKAAEPTPSVVLIRVPEDPQEREAFCADPKTWIADCGFIEPGDDFEFQAKQRDSLLQMMSMRPDRPEAVEAVQRYMKWVVGKASQAANMWYFNMVQNPDLDPTVSSPISEIGIALASRVENAASNEYFRLIREEGGILFYITRNDCIFCHDQLSNTQRVARTMGLPLINVPIDRVCLEGFEGETCGDNVTPEQIAVLDVKVVPALYLYVPTSTWIRLGTGVVPDSTIMANTVNFFSAYRAAMLNGLDNSSGARPSVTFDPNLRPRATGLTPVDGEQNAATPDRQKMMEMLGFEAVPSP